MQRAYNRVTMPGVDADETIIFDASEVDSVTTFASGKDDRRRTYVFMKSGIVHMTKLPLKTVIEMIDETHKGT